MASITHTIQVANWSVTGPNLVANSVCYVNLSADSPTSQTSAQIRAQFTGTIRVSQAATKNYDRLYITIKIQNTTDSSVSDMGFAYRLPSGITDTSTNISVSGSCQCFMDIQSSTNVFKVSQVQVTVIDKNQNLDLSSYLTNNALSTSPSLSITRASNTGAPTSVSVTPSTVTSSQAVTISWTAASNGSNNPVTGYTVYYNDDGGDTWNNFASVSASTTSQVVAGPTTNGTTRRYFVRANATYNTELKNSAIVSCTYMSSGVTAPSNFKISKDTIGTSSESATFNWNASQAVGVSGTITYSILYKNGSSTWTQLASTTSTSGTYNMPSGVSVGDVINFAVNATVGSYTSNNSNIVQVRVLTTYSGISTNPGGVLWTSDSIAIGVKSDSDGNITTLRQIDGIENSTIQMQAQARINTTSLRMRKSPGFATSGTNWDANVWKVNGSTTYLNSPSQYICYGGSGGNADNNGKLLYVTDATGKPNINKLLFAYASDGSYIQGGNITYGDNRSVFKLKSGLTVVIKRFPFGCSAESAGSSSIHLGNWFSDGSSFSQKPIVFYTIQHTYDGYASAPRRLGDVTETDGGEMYMGCWEALDTTSANRSTNCAGLLTVIAIGRKS